VEAREASAAAQSGTGHFVSRRQETALSEQPTNAPTQTAASVVSTANSYIIQSKRKQTVTVSVQTELTWPVGTDTSNAIGRVANLYYCTMMFYFANCIFQAPARWK